MRFVLVALLFLGACTSLSLSEEGYAYDATNAVRFDTGDARQGWVIYCDGPTTSMQLCERRAPHLCPTGFDRLEERQDRSAPLLVGGTTVPGVTRMLRIACHAPG